MKKKEFKSSSKRVLDLMINSIYTNKEIFLRELLSNASDAIDKLHYMSLTDKDIKVDTSKFNIHITPDKENKTFRHPYLSRLRPDKPAHDCKLEEIFS